MQQEQVFFTDNSIYVSSTRLVLRNGGTYPLTQLAQVKLGREPARRFWIVFLLLGLVLLVAGSVQNQGGPYLIIGGVALFLPGVSGMVFQMIYPLYVVMLKGSFGTAKPVKSRNRRHIVSIVTALNEALSKATHSGPISIYQGPVYGSITVGENAQANIGTSGHAENRRQEPTLDPVWSKPFSENRLHMLSQEARVAQPPPQFASTNSGACKIIISYSSEDRQWLERLKTNLAPLEYQQAIDLWDDSQIAAGMLTRQARSEALQAASIALLLVSSNFLASDVIMRDELPRIFQRYSQGQFTLLPLILSPCLYQESPLGHYRPLNPDKPLSTLSSAERDAMFVRVARAIQRAIA